MRSGSPFFAWLQIVQSDAEGTCKALLGLCPIGVLAPRDAADITDAGKRIKGFSTSGQFLIMQHLVQRETLFVSTYFFAQL